MRKFSNEITEILEEESSDKKSSDISESISAKSGKSAKNPKIRPPSIQQELFPGE